MTALAWITLVGVGVALFVVRLVMSNQLFPTTYTAPQNADIAAWSQTKVGQIWDEKAHEVQASALEDTRGLAAKWSATIGSLLGVFGIVVFAQGPDALTDIPGLAAYVVLILVLLAALAAGGAIYAGALAAQGTPAQISPLNGWTLKHLYENRIPDVLRQLRRSRALALSAAILIFGAVTIAWLATLHTRGSSSPLNVLVTFNDGSVGCGELKRSGEKLILVGAALTHVKAIAPVASCPD